MVYNVIGYQEMSIPVRLDYLYVVRKLNRGKVLKNINKQINYLENQLKKEESNVTRKT